MNSMGLSRIEDWPMKQFETFFARTAVKWRAYNACEVWTLTSQFYDNLHTCFSSSSRDCLQRNVYTAASRMQIAQQQILIASCWPRFQLLLHPAIDVASCDALKPLKHVLRVFFNERGAAACLGI
jgi:hypothetical protein